MSKEVVLENGITVKGVTLLTVEEANKLPKEILNICKLWWLRSPGKYGYSGAACVNSDGSIYYYGNDVYLFSGAVRPALMISNLESSNLKIGDKFCFGRKEFDIISNTRALCIESIGKCKFREDWRASNANEYKASDIKKFLDNWYRGVVFQILKQVQKVNGMEVLGATLLTTEEAEKLPIEVRVIGDWWWLRSTGYHDFSTTCVDVYGSIDYNGVFVGNSYGSVRPALIINLKSSNLKIMDQFDFGDRRFEIISDTKALCMEIIRVGEFRKNWEAADASDYEVSDIKKVIDRWYKNTCETIEHSSKKHRSMLGIANMMSK